MQKVTIDRELLIEAAEAFASIGMFESLERCKAALDASEPQEHVAVVERSTGPGYGLTGVLLATAVLSEAVKPGDKLYLAGAAVHCSEPVAYLDLSKLEKGSMAYATGFRTGDAQTALFKEEGASITLGEKNLGCYGALYDGPSVRRAYTHTHLPGNQASAALGNAWMNARRGGDSIDAGLSLLVELERVGYGVFAL